MLAPKTPCREVVSKVQNFCSKLKLGIFLNKGLSLKLDDAVGNLIETEDSEGNIITMGYDIRGNKISIDDPDMGNWTYTYNALGQLTSQTDAVGNVTTKTYDLLGRVTQENYTEPGPEVTTHNFYYDGDGEYDELGALRYERSSNGTCRAFLKGLSLNYVLDLSEKRCRV